MLHQPLVGLFRSHFYLAKIFDPFFTTNEYCDGTGIGLSLTKRNIEKDLNGTIEVESAIGEGAKFIFKFPKKEKNE